MITLPEIEHNTLQGIVTASPITVPALAASLQQDQSKVHAACVALGQRGLAELSEQPYQEISLDSHGGGLLPERVIIGALARLGGSALLTDLPQHTPLDQRAVGQSLRWLKTKRWMTQRGRELTLTDVGRAALQAPGPDELLLDALARLGTVRANDLQTQGVPVQGALALLDKRKGLIKVKERVERLVAITAAGLAAWHDGQIQVRRQVNLLTSDMLQDGSWRDVDFRPYDVTLATTPTHPGKINPFQRVLAETRRVFLELGFSEIASPFVESSFWDFDALFQPQDHPAREMQDTFYVTRPARCRLPDASYVDAVAATHEDGGSTGSVGWRYRFDRQLAHRPVLRTHCTAATVRALAQDPTPPRKVFCVGKVFRRETVDYKHLPVFHQVDGIIIDERASFATLLGTLDAFYKKMGFSKVTFRPAFFPYTEPSVEVFVWLEERQDWVELGGAGVFRPEVTEPTGCTVPVLAWGLGLERLAMFRYGVSDIRDLYMADLDWLKGVPLCR